MKIYFISTMKVSSFFSSWKWNKIWNIFPVFPSIKSTITIDNQIWLITRIIIIKRKCEIWMDLQWHLQFSNFRILRRKVLFFKEFIINPFFKYSNENNSREKTKKKKKRKLNPQQRWDDECVQMRTTSLPHQNNKYIFCVLYLSDFTLHTIISFSISV